MGYRQENPPGGRIFPEANQQGNELKQGTGLTPGGGNPRVAFIGVCVIRRTWGGKISNPHFYPSLRSGFGGQALERMATSHCLEPACCALRPPSTSGSRLWGGERMVEGG